MKEIETRLKRLEDHAPQLDGVGLITPAENGFALHLGPMHKDGFPTMEAAEEYFHELQRTKRTKSQSLIIWDLADNYREGREKDAE